MRSARPAWILAACILLGLAAGSGCRTTSDSPPANSAPTVQPVPEKLRQELELANFYQKYVDAGGLPVLGSSNVSDHALLEARWILLRMLQHKPEILQVMATNHA